MRFLTSKNQPLKMSRRAFLTAQKNGDSVSYRRPTKNLLLRNAKAGKTNDKQTTNKRQTDDKQPTK